MIQQRTVGIFVFDGMAAMDFTGPYEVFSIANFEAPEPYFSVVTVGATKTPVAAYGGLTIQPTHGFADCPPLDIIVVPGGMVEGQLEQSSVIEWLQRQHQTTEITFSVCNGALLLAKAGVLQGLKATTHHMFFAALAALDSSIEVLEGQRFVDNGKVVTSAGISAGIDAALHIVWRLFGKLVAEQTVSILEYESTAYRPAGE